MTHSLVLKSNKLRELVDLQKTSFVSKLSVCLLLGRTCMLGKHLLYIAVHFLPQSVGGLGFLGLLVKVLYFC